jgi:nucleoside-diphosphate-sugar epimerase
LSETVLVTGASGFLGRDVAAALDAAGYRVVHCVRRRPAGVPAARILECDFQNPSQVLALEQRCRPAVVVHLASDVTLTTNDDSSLFAPNVLATACIAHLARQWNAHLIFASSVSVHGVRAVQIGPDAALDADTAYGRSKLLGEQVIQASGARYCILRIAGIFGANGPRHLGLNRAIDAAIGGAVPTVVGRGTARRNYIYVRDAANAVLAATEQRLEGVHHLAGSDVVSIQSMMQLICDIFVPGSGPQFAAGGEASDQVIEPSPRLPTTRSFASALQDIRAAAMS